MRRTHQAKEPRRSTQGDGRIRATAVRKATAGAPKRLGWKPRDILALFVLTFRRWSADKVPKLAAALAYYTAFSIGPIILIAIAAAGLVFGSDAARAGVSSQISALVGDKAGESIQTLLQNSWKPSTGIVATILGALGLVFGSMGVFGELQDSLNIIWSMKKKEGRGILGTLKDRLLSFGMVAGIGFLLLVSLVLSAGLEALNEAVLGGKDAGLVVRILQEAVSLALISLLFAFCFKVLPDARTRWRDVGIGAFLTAALFTLGKFLIGLYLGKSSIGSAFGAAGSLALLLLWVFYSAQIFYFGAEFTKATADTHGAPPKPDPDAVPDRRMGLG